MKENQHQIIERVFEKQSANGLWKVLPTKHKYYPDAQHYVPMYSASLWVLILLADLKIDRKDVRIKKPLSIIKDHLFDTNFGIYSLKEDHFPIPCLNGNMLYLDAYFNEALDKRSKQVIDFFVQYQRFDDGCYKEAKNEYCSNKSCYGTHSCYWGITKLLKGLSFIPKQSRTPKVQDLLDKCIAFVLLHKVCYRSHKPDKIMIKKIDYLTFPNMYKSDFLEILWLLQREEVQSEALQPALELLQSKQQTDGSWLLERKIHNLITSIGGLNKPNAFITARAQEVLAYYK